MSRVIQHGKYDLCKQRGIGHDWFLTDVGRRSSFGTPVWHMCERCTTVRKRILDIHGEIAACYYEYPEDYRDQFKPTQAELRLREIAQYRTSQRMMKGSHDAHRTT